MIMFLVGMAIGLSALVLVETLAFWPITRGIMDGNLSFMEAFGAVFIGIIVTIFSVVVLTIILPLPPIVCVVLGVMIAGGSVAAVFSTKNADTRQAFLAGATFFAVHLALSLIISVCSGSLNNSATSARDDSVTPTEEMEELFGESFTVQSPEQNWLGGIQITKDDQNITSIFPVFIDVESKYTKGELYGEKTGDDKGNRSFKKGYGVTTIDVCHDKGELRSLQLNFSKIKPDGTPDSSDTLKGDLLGFETQGGKKRSFGQPDQFLTGFQGFQKDKKITVLRQIPSTDAQSQ